MPLVSALSQRPSATDHPQHLRMRLVLDAELGVCKGTQTYLLLMQKFPFSVSWEDGHPRSRKFYYWPTLIDKNISFKQEKKSRAVISTHLSYHITLQ